MQFSNLWSCSANAQEGWFLFILIVISNTVNMWGEIVRAASNAGVSGRRHVTCVRILEGAFYMSVALARTAISRICGAASPRCRLAGFVWSCLLSKNNCRWVRVLLQTVCLCPCACSRTFINLCSWCDHACSSACVQICVHADQCSLTELLCRIWGSRWADSWCTFSCD